MNAKQQIEQHIARQTDSTTKTAARLELTREQVKAEILSQKQQIKTLEAALRGALKRIEALEQRPTGLSGLFK